MELDEREREVLRLACLQVDRAAQLDAVVDAEGVSTRGSTGQTRVHPAVGEARQAALAAGRLLGLLALPAGEDERPMTAAQRRAQHAAQARYHRRDRRKAHGA